MVSSDAVEYLVAYDVAAYFNLRSNCQDLFKTYAISLGASYLHLICSNISVELPCFTIAVTTMLYCETYCCLLDMITKNLSKIEDPRGDGDNQMSMF